MKVLDNLTSLFEKLPGVGPKTALRYAHFIMDQSDKYAESLAKGITDIKKNIKLCPECFNFCSVESEACLICSNPARINDIICIVCHPKDIPAIESTEVFKGKYHVTNGYLSWVEGKKPDRLNFGKLIERLADVSEVIIAFDRSPEAQATKDYLKMLLPGMKLTEISSGIPVGGTIDYMDKETIEISLRERKEM